MLSGQLLRNARCFEDKLEIHFIILCSKAHSSKAKEALEAVSESDASIISKSARLVLLKAHVSTHVP